MPATDPPSDIAIDVASQLHYSALRLLRMLRAARPEKGWSMARFSVLGRLHQGGVTTATALAAYLRIQPQSVTRLLAELERQRWIARRPNAADRRQSLIEITEAGTRLLLEEVRHQQALLAQSISAALSPVEQEMLRLATGLMDRLVAEAEARAAPADTPKQDARRPSEPGTGRKI